MCVRGGGSGEANLLFGIVREDKGNLKGVRRKIFWPLVMGDRAPNKDPMLAVEPVRARRKVRGGTVTFLCQPFVSEAKPHLLPAVCPWLKSQVRLQLWSHIPEASFPPWPPALFLDRRLFEKAAKEGFLSLLLLALLQLLISLFFLGDFLT